MCVGYVVFSVCRADFELLARGRALAHEGVSS